MFSTLNCYPFLFKGSPTIVPCWEVLKPSTGLPGQGPQELRAPGVQGLEVRYPVSPGEVQVEAGSLPC
jgi:hypothetical protein